MLTRHLQEIRLIAGDAHPALAKALADELGIPLTASEVTTFADRETHVHVSEEVRNAAVFIVQPTCPPVNDHLMALALLADAARAAGASQVNAVVPYFGYARQDQRAKNGDSRSAQVAARLLSCVGVDHVFTVDLHSPALESALPMPTTLLSAVDVFVPHVLEWSLSDLVIVSPDAGGVKRAQQFASALSAPLAIVTKRRPHADVADSLSVLGDVKWRDCVIVDDMASTGRTLRGAADALREAGARKICGVFTHAVMSPEAEHQLLEARFSRLLTSNSIPVAGEAWLGVTSIVPLLAETIRHFLGEIAPCPR